MKKIFLLFFGLTLFCCSGNDDKGIDNNNSAPNNTFLENYAGTIWIARNGWTFRLTNLKAYLEHGVLLNETEIDLREN